MAFSLTEKQSEAVRLLSSDASDILLEGGSRSGKTFIALRSIATRAVASPKSRHLVAREHFNHVKTAIVLDTWPKMMDLCFPGLRAPVSRTDWYAQFPNGAEVWFGGLDDNQRTEKILGKEFATLFLNEISQISWGSRNLVLTRLAQKCEWTDAAGNSHPLRLKAYYDCNPPSKAHWSYRLFHERVDPESRRPLQNCRVATLLMNPADNAENLPASYISDVLGGMSRRMKDRFLLGKYAEVAPGALWTVETLDRWRITGDDLPQFVRIVVAVDPSGASDDDQQRADAIGIVVAALGTDGNAYLLEDLTIKAGPAKWGSVATSAFERHGANSIIAERNFGGEMVRHVIQTARANTPCKLITASRGKVARADPIAALHETGKIRLVGQFPDLEDELLAFTTTGYRGEGSPNRGDAFVWAMSELFPGLVKAEEKKKDSEPEARTQNYAGPHGWMS